MDPVTLSVLGLGVGASTYGAYKQDQLNREALAYQKKRDALGDKRQAAQDQISEQERKRRQLMEMLAMSEQQRQRNASQWHPTMARQPQPQAVG